MSEKPSTPESRADIPFYRDEQVLSTIAQVVSAILIIGLVIFALLNFFAAADARNLDLGFGFLNKAAGFPISEAHIEYDPSMSFGRAFLTGLINTLLVASTGIVAATIFGVLVALSRMSSNWLLSRLALIYIEFHRNIPLLILLYLWYFTVFQKFPDVNNSIEIGDNLVLINQRGFFFTWPRVTEAGSPFVISVLVAIAAALMVFIILRRQREITGKDTYYGRISLAILLILPTAGWFLSGGSPYWLDVPELTGFNFEGGLRITPEFAGLFVGLVTYTAGFIAEVVRAGVQAVDRGQIEAARATGLTYIQVLTLVVMPQALRIIIPPMISQYLNLTKNSSLALFIGYQDLFGVTKIAINNAGRAVPAFALAMGTYLVLSLLTSLVLNLYNRRIQFVTK